MSGIVGVTRQKDVPAAGLLLYGLYALQHRGQINAGIATLVGKELVVKKGTGQVNEIFREEPNASLPGSRGVGHVKYGNYEKYDLEQPLLPKEYEFKGQKCLITVDGNILNEDFSLKEMAESLIGSRDKAIDYFKRQKGAYGVIYLDKQKMLGIRDPWGLKPLCVGWVDQGYMIASETCAIDSAGGELIRMLEPGEMVVIKDNNLEFIKYASKAKKSCLFEMIYVARPDSYIDGVSIYKARNRMGKRLYYEKPTEADIVMGAPDSGLIAAIGYAEASGIPYKDGIIKNRYIGRTFIDPNDTERVKDIFIKLNPIKEVLKGKRIILVDDSVVRGMTTKRTIRMLKEAGATEVHVRISAPMVKHACNLSLDIPDAKALIAYNKSLEETRKEIGADSLYFLSLEGLKESCSSDAFCDHCFTGNYPIKEEYESRL